MGVSRVGSLAKSLMIKSDREFHLVVICAQWPTTNLFEQISTMLFDNFPVCVIHSPDRRKKHLGRWCRKTGELESTSNVIKRKRSSKCEAQSNKARSVFPSRWLLWRFTSMNRPTLRNPNNYWTKLVASVRSMLCKQFDGFKWVFTPR